MSCEVFEIETRQKADLLFSRQTPLAAGASWLSDVSEVDGYGAVNILAVSDKAFTLIVEEAITVDGPWIQTLSKSSSSDPSASGSMLVCEQVAPCGNFMRLSVVNGAAAETRLNVSANGLPVAGSGAGGSGPGGTESLDQARQQGDTFQGDVYWDNSFKAIFGKANGEANQDYLQIYSDKVNHLQVIDSEADGTGTVRNISVQIAGTEVLGISASGVTVTGKLTVTGAIDPTSVSLSGGTALYFESADGITAPVAPASHARIRYNDTTKTWQQSIDGGAYSEFGGGPGIDTTAWHNTGDNYAAGKVLGTISNQGFGVITNNLQRMFVFTDYSVQVGAAGHGDAAKVIVGDGPSELQQVGALRVVDCFADFNGEYRMYIRNKNAGAATLSSVRCDNNLVEVVSQVPHYTEFGITSSGWGGTALAADEAFWVQHECGLHLINYGDYPIKFSVQATETPVVGEVMRITEDGQIVMANSPTFNLAPFSDEKLFVADGHVRFHHTSPNAFIVAKSNGTGNNFIVDTTHDRVGMGGDPAGVDAQLYIECTKNADSHVVFRNKGTGDALAAISVQNDTTPGIFGSEIFMGISGTSWSGGGAIAANTAFIQVGATDFMLQVYGNKDMYFETNHIERMRLYADGGLVLGAPTGGSKGVGTLNVATNIYLNDSAYANPDYALECWATGKVERFSRNPGAQRYARRSLEEMEVYCRNHFRLPGIDDLPPGGISERFDFLLEKVEELFTHFFDLKKELRDQFAAA